MRIFTRRWRWGLMVVIALAGIGGTTLLTGCNTLEGVGKDIEEAGESIQDAAN